MSSEDDVALARALERCEVPNAGFRHASHLRVALVYLKESASVDDAIDRMASVGHPEKYSQPTTEFWMYQIASAHAVLPDADGDALLAAFPWLLDKNLSRAA